jgi:ABC-2 type transport system ATP-binding protein
MNVIELKNISKSFKKRKVIDEVNLTIQRGEFVVLRGANGAGKTTLLNIILGLLKPDRGEAKLLGNSPEEPKSKYRVGVVLQKVTAPKELKVKELVNLLRSYYPNPLSTEDILKKVNLEDKHDFWASKLSGGEGQRLYFALALAGNPDLLILDEPTRNLDAEGYSDFWNQIEACRKSGITILMVTNNQSDWEKLNYLATRFITLKDGSLEEEIINSNETKTEQVKLSPSLDGDRSKALKPRWFNTLLNQTWVELIQLLRTPTYLLGIFLFSLLVLFFLFVDIGQKELALLFFAGISLLTFAIQRLSERIAAERIEGWLKLLRVTPLPPAMYLTAKTIMSLFVSAAILLLVLSLGGWSLKLYETISRLQWLKIFFGLIMGMIPFIILGLALGYLFKPKGVSGIVSMCIPLAVFTCGFPLLPFKVYLDAQAFSPFYHYGQLALWSAGLDYDNQLMIHVMWLLWAVCVFSLLAVWAYRRDRVLE